jgi:hypothetical protein
MSAESNAKSTEIDDHSWEPILEARKTEYIVSGWYKAEMCAVCGMERLKGGEGWVYPYNISKDGKIWVESCKERKMRRALR